MPVKQQKFTRGDTVNVALDPEDPERYGTNEVAIVVGSYADQFGGCGFYKCTEDEVCHQHSTYTLMFPKIQGSVYSGKISWFDEEHLSFVSARSKETLDLLDGVKSALLDMGDGQPKRTDQGTPGRLVVPLQNPGGVNMDDVIQIKGHDPDFPGMLRLWHGSVVEITKEHFTIDGRFWIGNESAIRELAGHLSVPA